LNLYHTFMTKKTYKDKNKPDACFHLSVVIWSAGWYSIKQMTIWTWVPQRFYERWFVGAHKLRVDVERTWTRSPKSTELEKLKPLSWISLTFKEGTKFILRIKLHPPTCTANDVICTYIKVVVKKKITLLRLRDSPREFFFPDLRWASNATISDLLINSGWQWNQPLFIIFENLSRKRVQKFAEKHSSRIYGRSIVHRSHSDTQLQLERQIYKPLHTSKQCITQNISVFSDLSHNDVLWR